MNDLSALAITREWPARHPDRLQRCSLPTPYRVKVSIMLEETGLPCEPHLVRFDKGDQLSPEFLSPSPNNKIPAILDPLGPESVPLPLFESGACPIGFYEAGGLVDIEKFKHVTRALEAFKARPAVIRGLGIPARTAA